MRFDLSPSLVARLREAQARRGWRDRITEAEDAFLLDGGLGPALYLTTDGRVLVDGSAWDGAPLCEASEDDATLALVVGAKKTGVTDLLALLPLAPASAEVCANCGGSRWASMAPGVLVACRSCHGCGWTLSPGA